MVILHEYVNGLYKGLNSSLQCAVVLMLAQRHYAAVQHSHKGCVAFE